MKRWIIKSVIQRFISYLPASHRWNELFQTFVTKGSQLSLGAFEGKLQCCRRHLEFYRSFSPTPKESLNILELGTGVFPILPLGLYLCGAGEIVSFDIVPLLRRATLKRTLELFLELARVGRLNQSLPGVLPERVQKLKDLYSEADHASPVTLLQKLNIRALLHDAQNTGLPNASIDLVFSNFVLEHVPAKVLTRLYAEFKRVHVPSGVMSHYIGLEDQFSSFDHSITPYNFLRYTNAQWKWLDSPIVPQTRLRLPDHRALIRQAGYLIVKEAPVSGTVDQLRQVKRAPEFEKYSEEDLLPRYSWIVARPA